MFISILILALTCLIVMAGRRPVRYLLVVPFAFISLLGDFALSASLLGVPFQTMFTRATALINSYVIHLVVMSAVLAIQLVFARAVQKRTVRHLEAAAALASTNVVESAT